jgi:hypothetical protein
VTRIFILESRYFSGSSTSRLGSSSNFFNLMTYFKNATGNFMLLCIDLLSSSHILSEAHARLQPFHSNSTPCQGIVPIFGSLHWSLPVQVVVFTDLTSKHGGRPTVSVSKCSMEYMPVPVGRIFLHECSFTLPVTKTSDLIGAMSSCKQSTTTAAFWITSQELCFLQ